MVVDQPDNVGERTDQLIVALQIDVLDLNVERFRSLLNTHELHPRHARIPRYRNHSDALLLQPLDILGGAVGTKVQKVHELLGITSLLVGPICRAICSDLLHVLCDDLDIVGRQLTRIDVFVRWEEDGRSGDTALSCRWDVNEWRAGCSTDVRCRWHGVVGEGGVKTAGRLHCDCLEARYNCRDGFAVRETAYRAMKS